MAVTVPTAVTPMPTAPVRGEDRATFVSKSNAFVAAMPTFGTESNTLADVTYDNAVDAETSATESAASAVAALASEGDAATSATGAAGYELTAQTAAAAAQSAAGLPSLVGNAGAALRVNDAETAVEWGQLQVVGDIDITADYDSHSVPAWLECDGDLYDTGVYADLYGVLGDFPLAITNPSTAPAGSTKSSAFSSDGTYLAMTGGTSPFIYIYKRSGDVFTKLADPATLPPSGPQAVAFDATDTYLCVTTTAASPNITIYKRSGDTFTKLADPVGAPGSVAYYGATFSPDSTYLALATNTSPFIYIYKRSGDVFTKLADPATLPPGAVNTSYPGCIAFDGTSTYLSIVTSTSPYITIYKRSGDVFTKLADPATLPAGQTYSCAFSPDGVYFAVGLVKITSFESLYIYKRSGDVFTKLPTAFTFTHFISGCKFNSNGTELAIGTAISPFMFVLKRSGDDFEVQPNPLSLPPATSYSIAYSGDSSYLQSVGNTAANSKLYKGVSNLPDIDTGDLNTKAYIKTGL